MPTRFCLIFAILCIANVRGTVGQEMLVPREPPQQLAPDWLVDNLVRPAGLVREQIRTAAFERSGTIWVAAGAGVYRYDGYQSKFFGTEDGLPNSVVNSLLVDRYGAVWAATSTGVAVLKVDDTKFVFNSQIGKQSVDSVFESRDGTLWFCCGSRGLFRQAKGKLTAHSVESCLPGASVLRFYEDSLGRRFALTTGGLAQEVDGEWISPLTGRFENTNGTFRGVAESSDRSLVFSSDSVVFVLRDDDDWTELPVDRIHQVFNDNEGRVYSIAPVEHWADRDFAFFEWDGDGFARASPKFRLIKNWSYWQGASPDGSIWMVSYNRLIRWHRGTSQWTIYDDAIRPQLIDRHKRIWFSGEATAVVRDGDEWFSLNRVSWPHETADGSIWFHSPLGVDNSLIRVTGRNVSRTSISITGLRSSNYIRTDGAGQLWVIGLNDEGFVSVATREGEDWLVTVLGKANERCYAASGDGKSGVWLILADDNQQLPRVVGVHDGKVTSTPALPPFEKSAAADIWIQLLSDVQRRLWLRWDQRILMLDDQAPKSWRDKTAALNGVVRGWTTSGDTTVFAISSEYGGRSGLARFSDEHWKLNLGAEPTWFDRWDLQSTIIGADSEFHQVIGDDIRRVSLPFEDSAFNGVMEDDGTTWLSVRGSLLRFKSDGIAPKTQIVSIPALIEPGEPLHVQVSATARFANETQPPIRFQRKIDDGEWSALMSAEEVSEVTNLKLRPGIHQIAIRATDESGDTESLPASAKFQIRIPVWKQPWFFGLMSLFTAAIVIQTTRVVRRGQQLRSAEFELRKQEVLAEVNRVLEDKIAARTEALNETNQELEAFAHSVSHDLRAPLRAMEGFAVALAEDHGEQLGDSGAKYIRYIIDSAKRMDELVNGLLEYSRLGRENIPTSCVSLEHCLEEASARLQVSLRESKGRIEVVGELPDVKGHRSTVTRILQNLLSNSLKFVKPGVSPVVYVSAVVRENMVRVTIKDNGIGIAPEYHRRIFSVFERLHGLEEYEGTGIGLAIVNRACQRLAGSCGLNSASGEGSEFWFELPHWDEPK